MKGTFDEAFLRRRIDLNQIPRTKKDKILRPFRDLGNGIYCGIVGVVKVRDMYIIVLGFKGLEHCGCLFCLNTYWILIKE